jgi:hypothetical protein
VYVGGDLKPVQLVPVAGTLKDAVAANGEADVVVVMRVPVPPAYIADQKDGVTRLEGTYRIALPAASVPAAGAKFICVSGDVLSVAVRLSFPSFSEYRAMVDVVRTIGWENDAIAVDAVLYSCGYSIDTLVTIGMIAATDAWNQQILRVCGVPLAGGSAGLPDMRKRFAALGCSYDKAIATHAATRKPPAAGFKPIQPPRQPPRIQEATQRTNVLIIGQYAERLGANDQKPVGLDFVSRDVAALSDHFGYRGANVRVSPLTVLRSALTKADFNRTFSAFMAETLLAGQDYAVLCYLGHAVDGTGDIKTSDGTVSFADVLALRDAACTSAARPLHLLILHDACSSGGWVDVARASKRKDVTVQASVDARTRAPDGMFTKRWILSAKGLASAKDVYAACATLKLAPVCWTPLAPAQRAELSALFPLLGADLA